MKTLLFVLTLSSWLVLLHVAKAQDSGVPNLATPQEKHLKNVRQLTFGGQNAVKQAEVAALSSVVTRAQAEAILEYFRK